MVATQKIMDIRAIIKCESVPVLIFKNTLVIESMEPEKEKEEKTYLTSKKKWGDFDIHPDIIEVLKFDNKFKPTRIQQETLTITTSNTVPYDRC